MMNIAQLLTGHIDIWTAAESEKKSGRGRASGNAGNVYGIKKLRELILELAVRGKLVPQDPNDEPASELLKRIQAEKLKLVLEGKLKKEKSFSPIAEDEKLFELPKGWEWQKLTEFTLKITDGEHLSPQKTSEGMPLVSAKDVKDEGVDLSETNFVKYEDGLSFRQRCNPEDGDILICSRGTIGRCALVQTSKVFCLMGSVILLKTSEVSNPKYLTRYLQSSLAQKWMTGASSATAVSALYLKDVAKLAVPVPPIEEQHRIVAKVDELMALCNQLEQQHSNAQEAHETLVSQLLATLTQSKSAEEFNANWQRIYAHFDVLFTTESSIDALKQTLLQLAVMGKLVSQDLNDEHASDLLKRIQAEKAKLIAEGKLKKEKPLPPIADDEKPFELPKGWEWARLELLANLITKGSSPKWQGVNYTDNTNDVLFVTSENVGSYSLLLDSPKFVEAKFNEIEPRSILQKGDYLMNIVGASIGRTATFDRDGVANINQAVCLIRIENQDLSKSYLLHFFNSQTCLDYMFDKQVDNARPNLSMGNIAKFLIPIPPFAEQHRIIAKVDELVALCDQLKTRIQQASLQQQAIADALVAQAVT
jgi:type I restriction enzyme S subunit